MPLVTRWTGHEIRAFSEALRMTPLDLAHKLGVSHRIIAVRETDGEDARLRMVSQAALDTLLAQSDADVHGRFVGLLPGADGPAPGQLVPAMGTSRCGSTSCTSTSSGHQRRLQPLRGRHRTCATESLGRGTLRAGSLRPPRGDGEPRRRPGVDGA
jgi:hypothetical protein